jgi:thymidine kinase
MEYYRNTTTSIMEHTNTDTGYLGLYIGPMYSGKTSKLIELYKQFNFCGVNTMTINYAEDTRYSNYMLSTHDMNMIPCIMATTLSEVADIVDKDIVDVVKGEKKFMNSRIILINEGQFFKDIVDWVKTAVCKYNKCVYICGLDGDFRRELFGNWLDLIPLCDNVEKLHSFCNGCKKKPALFSHRISSEKEQKVIGSDSKYVPLCRKCYDYEMTNKNKHENESESIDAL